ncbi:MAG: 3-isopropylmalate dehydratase [Pseudomonadota bacterium]
MTGRVWLFGDDVDTDALAPGAYMKRPIAELAAHCLEALDPAFAAGAAPGDYVVAGRNFGMGSSREQAAEALLVLGIRAVLAESFAGIFYRNAFNLGLPALVLAPGARGTIGAGDRIAVDLASGRVDLDGGARQAACEPVPALLRGLIEAGGLVPHLEQRLKERAQ